MRPLSQKNSSFNKIELHSHTTHSDAEQTIQQLISTAIQEELDWIAITDHNTITAIAEGEKITKDFGLGIIPGLEFTTYYGHFLIHGKSQHLFKNWTEVNKGNIQKYLKMLHDQGIIITIAHPFAQGNPFCTGCRWDYKLPNLYYIDSIEVWNRVNPYQYSNNGEAFELWQYLLACGYEISSTCGRDWHAQKNDSDIVAYIYLLLNENPNLEDVLEALSLGRSYSSCRITLNSFTLNEIYQLGDRCNIDKEDYINIDISLSNLSEKDIIEIWDEKQLLFNWQNDLNKKNYQIKYTVRNKDISLIRLIARNFEGDMMMFTNPIYVN